jgi:putative acetyltransferase
LVFIPHGAGIGSSISPYERLFLRASNRRNYGVLLGAGWRQIRWTHSVPGEQMNCVIRKEESKDYRTVEEITRKAFWNIHAPGCNEHYLVHRMRSHPDFIPELGYVIEKDGLIIGNIMYARSKLVSKNDIEKTILTFGPVGIHPEHQRKGYGKALIEYSFSNAIKLKYDVIVIYGNPGYYVQLGFKSCSKYDVALTEGIYPTALLVKELVEGALFGNKWLYKESEAYNLDENEAEKYDLQFEKMEKRIQGSQEEFYILSNSRIIQKRD